MIAAMLALLIVLGIGGFVAYRMSQSGEAKDTTTAGEPAKASDSAVAPVPADRAKDAAAQTPTTSEPAKDQVAATPAPEVPKPATTPSGATAAAPAKATAAAKSLRNPPPAAAGGTGSSETPAPVPAAPVARVAQPAAAAPQPDRWQQMQDAMARCKREDFFRRIGCEQSVGLQYCEGYWGKVPQCPGAPRESGR